MPPAASSEPTLNREAVELALKWHGIALAELLPVWGVRVPERWPDHPLVRDFVSLTALQVLEARGCAAGLSPTAARKEACMKLGLKFRTVTSRLQDHRKAYLQANERPTKPDGKSVQIVKKNG